MNIPEIIIMLSVRLGTLEKMFQHLAQTGKMPTSQQFESMRDLTVREVEKQFGATIEVQRIEQPPNRIITPTETNIIT